MTWTLSTAKRTNRYQLQHLSWGPVSNVAWDRTRLDGPSFLIRPQRLAELISSTAGRVGSWQVCRRFYLYRGKKLYRRSSHWTTSVCVWLAALQPPLICWPLVSLTPHLRLVGSRSTWRQARWYIAGVHARSGLSGSFNTIASVGDMGLGGPWASDALMWSSIFGCFEIYRLNLGFPSIFK